MNGRKPVQIAAVYDPGDDGHRKSDIALHALCDDGTMWINWASHGDGWKAIPPIPQDAVPEPAAVRPGPVTAAEVSRAMAANSALQDIGHTTCSAMESVLTDFLAAYAVRADAALRVARRQP